MKKGIGMKTIVTEQCIALIPTAFKSFIKQLLQPSIHVKKEYFSHNTQNLKRICEGEIST